MEQVKPEDQTFHVEHSVERGPIVTGSSEGAELDVKRFYIPGVSVKSLCPFCRRCVTRDLGENYLSNPVIGSPEPVSFHCESEDHYEEWTVDVILHLAVSIYAPVSC